MRWAIVVLAFLSGCCARPCPRPTRVEQIGPQLRVGMTYEEVHSVLRPHLTAPYLSGVGSLGFMTVGLRDGESITLAWDYDAGDTRYGRLYEVGDREAPPAFLSRGTEDYRLASWR